jgi:hypothetical protein
MENKTRAYLLVKSDSVYELPDGKMSVRIPVMTDDGIEYGSIETSRGAVGPATKAVKDANGKVKSEPIAGYSKISFPDEDHNVELKVQKSGDAYESMNITAGQLIDMNKATKSASKTSVLSKSETEKAKDDKPATIAVLSNRIEHGMNFHTGKEFDFCRIGIKLDGDIKTASLTLPPTAVEPSSRKDVSNINLNTIAGCRKDNKIVLNINDGGSFTNMKFSAEQVRDMVNSAREDYKKAKSKETTAAKTAETTVSDVKSIVNDLNMNLMRDGYIDPMTEFQKRAHSAANKNNNDLSIDMDALYSQAGREKVHKKVDMLADKEWTMDAYSEGMRNNRIAFPVMINGNPHAIAIRTDNASINITQAMQTLKDENGRIVKDADGKPVTEAKDGFCNVAIKTKDGKIDVELPTSLDAPQPDKVVAKIDLEDVGRWVTDYSKANEKEPERMANVLAEMANHPETINFEALKNDITNDILNRDANEAAKKKSSSRSKAAQSALGDVSASAEFSNENELK